mmetsp:Transcript_52963/g.60693  ORF Transcript_52963/g.60693 Transcript_52963/m.60693 type:complete len:144 (+) Transcript_52963:1296-1727(+)
MLGFGKHRLTLRYNNPLQTRDIAEREKTMLNITLSEYRQRFKNFSSLSFHLLFVANMISSRKPGFLFVVNYRAWILCPFLFDRANGTSKEVKRRRYPRDPSLGSSYIFAPFVCSFFCSGTFQRLKKTHKKYYHILLPVWKLLL